MFDHQTTCHGPAKPIDTCNMAFGYANGAGREQVCHWRDDPHDL